MEEHLIELSKEALTPLGRVEKRKKQMKTYYQTHKEQWKIYRKRAREKRKLKSSK